MKITDIRTHHLSYDYEEAWAYSQAWYTKRQTLLVEVRTEDGLIGWGEAFGAPTVARAVIESVFRPVLVGAEAEQITPLWERLYAESRGYGQKGAVIAALSAVDISLWDVLGKRAGLPVHTLLGGCFRERIPVYGTGMYYRPVPDLSKLIDRLVEEARTFVGRGFQAVKMKIGGRPWTEDREILRAIRGAIGPEIGLMVDANCAYDARTAIRIGRELEKHDVLWFEEPVPPEDVEGYLEVKRALDVPIAGGELEFTRYGFRDLIVHRAVDIVQPSWRRRAGSLRASRLRSWRRHSGFAACRTCSAPW
jgi:D-galactarolactone cycloisomerase